MRRYVPHLNNLGGHVDKSLLGVLHQLKDGRWVDSWMGWDWVRTINQLVKQGQPRLTSKNSARGRVGGEGEG